jgi:phage portal protein BeeE
LFNLFKFHPAKNAVTFSQSFSFGKATSGETVTERAALNTSAVYACVRVVSVAIASLPLRLKKTLAKDSNAVPNTRCAIPCRGTVAITAK